MTAWFTFVCIRHQRAICFCTGNLYLFYAYAHVALEKALVDRVLSTSQVFFYCLPQPGYVVAVLFLLLSSLQALGAIDAEEEDKWTLEELNIDFPNEWASNEFLEGRNW